MQKIQDMTKEGLDYCYCRSGKLFVLAENPVHDKGVTRSVLASCLSLRRIQDMTKEWLWYRSGKLFVLKKNTGQLSFPYREYRT